MPEIMCNTADWPVSPGSYLLILHVAHSAAIVIGRFGKVTVAPGWYLYTGSALGAGGAIPRAVENRCVPPPADEPVDEPGALNKIWLPGVSQ